MAETKLEIEKRMDEAEARLERQDQAISTMAQWLVQAQTGFNATDAEGIEKILRGDDGSSTSATSAESSETTP